MLRPTVWLAILLAGCALERKSVPFTPLAHCEVVECEGAWLWEDAERTHGSSSTGGGVSRSAGHSRAAVAVRDNDGNPIVAWQDDTSGTDQIRVSLWDGSSWTALAPLAGEHPALATLANGSVVVASLKDSGTDWEIRVQHWTGSDWAPLGVDAVLRTTGGPLTPYLDLASATGELFVTWAQYESMRYQIYLLSWSGTAWVELDGSATDDGISLSPMGGYRPSLAVDVSGQPIIAWEEFREATVAGVFLRAWQTDSWAAIAGSAEANGISGADNASFPSVIVDASGPVVSWKAAGGISVARPDTSDWQILSGSAIAGSGDSATPSLGLTESGDIMVAWSAFGDGPSQIAVTSWTGSTWTETASVTNDLGGSLLPSLFAPGGSAPLLVWQDDSTGLDPTGYPTAEIFLEEYNGSWHPFGSDTLTALTESGDGSALAPALAMSTSGPVVAWQRNAADGSAAIHALHFDGSTWIPLGSSSRVSAADDSVNRYPCLSQDGDTPTLAWRHTDIGGRTDIYVTQWDGVAWRELAGSASGSGISHDGRGDADLPALELVAGAPVVAWQGSDANDVFQIYLKRWSGSEWQELDGSASGTGVSDMNGGSYTAALAAIGDTLVVAWTRDTSSGSFPFQIYLRRWHNEGWTELGDSASGIDGISGTTGNSLFPTVAISDVGEPVVAWTEQSEQGRFTFVRHWHDGAGTWSELGASASGDGLGGVRVDNASATVGAHTPAISIDASGRMWVAWTDASIGINEIYARRWDGNTWESVDGSSEVGGISNSSAPSIHPALAANDQRACVAWMQGVARRTEIAVRCAGP